MSEEQIVPPDQEWIDPADKIDESNRKYSKSYKGKEARRKFNQSEKGKAAQKRYREKKKGKAAHQRYRESQKGKNTQERFKNQRSTIAQQLEELNALILQRQKQGLCTACGSANHTYDKEDPCVPEQSVLDAPQDR